MDSVAAHFVSIDDGALPGSKEEQTQLFLEWSLFNLDRYCAHVATLTVPTTFVQVDSPDKLLAVLSRDKHGHDEWLALLKVALDASMGGRDCFVKLQRSPKDAVDKPLLRGRVVDALHVELGALLNALGDERAPTQSELYGALKMSFGRALACRTASAVLDMFAVSNRIVSDLVRFRRLFQDSPDQKLYLAVRSFVDIPLHTEIRCFVFERRLTAASQYFTDLFFPQLQGPARNATFSARLFEVATRVIHALPSTEYVSFIMDVALLDDDRAFLIELNPFSKLTGSGLFDWENDKDILRGLAPFQLRVVSEERRGMHLAPQWQSVIEDVLGELGQSQLLEDEFRESTLVL